jgi:hypothetical protein
LYEYAFANSGIEYFEFGEQMKVYDTAHFTHSDIKKAVFLEGYEGDVKQSMFTGSAVEEVVLNETIAIIGNNAFSQCMHLQSIALKNVTEIRQNAFERTSLRSLSSPKLLSLGANAFKDCTVLKTVEFEKLINIYGSHAFEGCTNLEVVIMPQISSLQSDTFKDCKDLTSVTLSKTEPIFIQTSAFENCTSLKTVEGNISSVKSYAFLNCTALEELHVTISDINDIVSSEAFGGVSQEIKLYLNITYEDFNWVWYTPQNFTLYVPKAYVERISAVVEDASKVIAYDFEKDEEIA